jgi:very-short-patch-repair endonuclease
VQGDERDVIFISIGYGKSSDGYFSMNFGPLNKDGGERRLNVLITRARLRCEIFTNLRSSDIDLERSKSAGVAALKMYLEYAETGQLGIPQPFSRDDDSPFEDAVYNVLISKGLHVDRQVGTAGFFIDMAIVDPANPGKYILGIECDGATYHSARSARDRDRLRQDVLENLGWKLHRIWSTDWYLIQSKEVQRMLSAYDEALHATRIITEKPKPSVVKIQREQLKDISKLTPSSIYSLENKQSEYICAQLQINLWRNELHRLGNAMLSFYIKEVVDVESPVHKSEAFTRITDACGIKRQGTRIIAALDSAILYGVAHRAFSIRGEFLWTNEMFEKGIAQARNRNSLPATSRKIELVAPEEIEFAIRKIALESFGIARKDLPTEVCRLFGFLRSSSSMVSTIDSFIRNMIKEGYAKETEGVVYIEPKI